VALISLPDSESALLLLGAMLLSGATGVLAHSDGSVALGTPHADQPTGEVFAHTSPVYEEVLWRPVRAREDTSYLLIWVDRHTEDVRRRDLVPIRRRARIELHLNAARGVSRKLAGAGE
jgi:hypothetical protein